MCCFLMSIEMRYDMFFWKALGTITLIGGAYLIASAILTIIGLGLSILFKIVMTAIEIICGILLLTIAVFFLSGGQILKDNPRKEKK